METANQPETASPAYGPATRPAMMGAKSGLLGIEPNALWIPIEDPKMGKEPNRRTNVIESRIPADVKMMFRT